MTPLRYKIKEYWLVQNTAGQYRTWGAHTDFWTTREYAGAYLEYPLAAREAEYLGAAVVHVEGEPCGPDLLYEIKRAGK